MKKLIKEICLREGKRSQTSIANVRETIAVLMDVLAEDSFNTEGLFINEFDDAFAKRRKKLEKKKAKTKK